MALTNAQGKLVLLNNSNQSVIFSTTNNVLNSNGNIARSSAQSSSIVTSGLVAHYQFDNTITDSSGNGNDLSLNAGTATYVTGVNGFGSAFSFDGSTRLRTTGNPLRPAQNFTFDFWLKKTSNSSPHQQAFVLGNSWIIFLEANDGNTGSIRLDFETSTGAHADYGNYDWNPPTELLAYHHYVFSYDGSFARLYVDKVLRVKVAFSGTAAFSGANDQLGQSQGNTNGFIGAIDSFKVYSRALTDGGISNVGETAGGEIAQNYNALVPSIPTRGLVAWWKLEEATFSTNGILDTAFLSTGTGSNPANHGTRFGTSPIQEPGISGNCHSFSGDDYIMISNEPNFAQEWTQPRSVSFWLNNPTGAVGDIFSKSGGVGDKGFRILYFSPGHIRIQLMHNNGSRYIESWSNNGTSHIPNGEWHHIVFTHDGTGTSTGVKFYDNGVFLPTGNHDVGGGLTGGDTVLNNQNPAIGARAESSHSSFFQGLIDEVMYYSVALTQSEVLQLYQSFNTPIVTAGLVSWWRFNNNYNDSAVTDTGTGFSNNGTAVGTPGTFSNIFGFERNNQTNGVTATANTDYIDVGTSVSLRPTTAFTFEMKLKTSSTGDHKGGSFNELFDTGGAAVGNQGWLIATKNGADDALRFVIHNGVSTILETANGSFPFGVPCVATFTYDGSNMRIYKNGVEIASTPKTGALTYTFTGTVMSGRVRANLNGAPTDGVTGWGTGMKFDFMRVYSRALSATEILQNYNSGI